MEICYKGFRIRYLSKELDTGTIDSNQRQVVLSFRVRDHRGVSKSGIRLMCQSQVSESSVRVNCQSLMSESYILFYVSLCASDNSLTFSSYGEKVRLKKYTDS